MKTRLSSLGELNFGFLTLYALVNALTEPFLMYDSFRVFDPRAFTTTLSPITDTSPTPRTFSFCPIILPVVPTIDLLVGL